MIMPPGFVEIRKVPEEAPRRRPGAPRGRPFLNAIQRDQEQFEEDRFLNGAPVPEIPFPTREAPIRRPGAPRGGQFLSAIQRDQQNFAEDQLSNGVSVPELPFPTPEAPTSRPDIPFLAPEDSRRRPGAPRGRQFLNAIQRDQQQFEQDQLLAGTAVPELPFPTQEAPRRRPGAPRGRQFLNAIQRDQQQFEEDQLFTGSAFPDLPFSIQSTPNPVPTTALSPNSLIPATPIDQQPLEQTQLQQSFSAFPNFPNGNSVKHIPTDLEIPQNAGIPDPNLPTIDIPRIVPKERVRNFKFPLAENEVIPQSTPAPLGPSQQPSERPAFLAMQEVRSR